MNICQVLGTVVASEKHKAFAGRKLLVVQPLDEHRKPLGKSFIAIDNASHAGKGDLVLVSREGNGIRQTIKAPQACIRSMIVGVIDAIDVKA